MQAVLTIAGSDSIGGAGIQADLKTMIMNGVYGMSAITALTAQNTTGVTDIVTVAPAFLQAQIDAVFTDIPPCAVKIGMIASAELVEAVADRLVYYGAESIVLDPVMVATSGAHLIQNEAAEKLMERLFPLATLITPNISEAEYILGHSIVTAADMEKAAESIGNAFHVAVLLKGGHMLQNADDLLYANGVFRWFYGKRVQNPNTHGTGCTLSSAIAAQLAQNRSIEQAVQIAKQYVTHALEANLNLGKGSGPINHGFCLKTE